MFQFDQSDLDFGIYRIMSMKRNEINKFIEEDLPAQINADLRELATFDVSAIISDIDKQIADVREASLSDLVKNAAIAELEEKKKSLSGIDVTAVEGDIYSHLTNFFSRYYDDGDFISQRRYKDGVYAIPYEGEEVKLHWANADQYYVKTSEYFKDYVFTTKYGDVIHFKLMEADVERDNNKANEKRFFQLHAKNPFEIIDGELFIHVEYKASDQSGRTAQAKHIEEIVSAFTAVQARMEFQAFEKILEVAEGKSLLERQLIQYTARNTFDYFIHKDLATFLNRELDFYIKNDVIYLDDIDEQDEVRTKEYLIKAKVIRKIARKIITFLAQIENFQKKLYLKKKFVVETNYCITLDRVPEHMFGEIVANEKQREEWVRLFAIDEIVGNDIFAVSYTNPLTTEFLKANPFLVLDTAFFSEEFKEQLVASIDDLDEKLDGLMIHSENLQAIRLLEKRYQNKIKCIYIDPPYNAKSSEILYKNTFKDSAWLSMMDSRIECAAHLLTDDFVNIVAIDEIEQELLGQLLSQKFPGKRKACISIVHNPRGQQGTNISYTHEFAYFVYPSDSQKYIADVKRAQIDSRTLRDSGTESDRTDAATCFYPFLVKDNKIIGIGDVPDDDVHPSSNNVRRPDGVMEIWPIDDNGNEKKWRYSVSSVAKILPKLEIKKLRNSYQVIFNQDMGVMRSLWVDAKYDASEYGTKMLQDILGTDYVERNASNMYPKSIYTEQDCITAGLNENTSGIVLDYFAGSGTTGHSVINMNRDDGGKRKFILVEMGNHFDTIAKLKLEKVIYSMDTPIQKGWRDGKPLSRKGSSHAFKYLRLESYDDALNNIVLRDAHADLLGGAQEGYFLSYMLDTETSQSASLLNVERLDKPFDYWMNITRNLESKRQRVDLVETFNYLIGLTVKRSHSLVSFDADFATGEYGAVSAVLKAGETYKIKAIEGIVPNGDKALVLWREMTGDIEKDNAVLDAYFLSISNARSFKRIYVNCDNNLLNLRNNGENWRVTLIDEEMKKRMFEDTE